MIARRIRVVWVLARHGPRGEAAPQRQQRVDEDRRAVPLPPVSKVAQKVLLAQRRKRRVLPAKVQRQQVLHEVVVVGDGRPRPLWCLELRLVHVRQYLLEAAVLWRSVVRALGPRGDAALRRTPSSSSQVRRPVHHVRVRVASRGAALALRRKVPRAALGHVGLRRLAYVAAPVEAHHGTHGLDGVAGPKGGAGIEQFRYALD